MGSQTVRRLGVTLSIGALITSGAVLAGCGKGGQPTTPTPTTTTTTTTTTTVEPTPTEKGILPTGTSEYTPGPPPHSNGVAMPPLMTN